MEWMGGAHGKDAKDAIATLADRKSKGNITEKAGMRVFGTPRH
jgi:hypothetical protein